MYTIYKDNKILKSTVDISGEISIANNIWWDEVYEQRIMYLTNVLNNISAKNISSFPIEKVGDN